MISTVRLAALSLFIAAGACMLEPACAADVERGKALFQTCAACHNAVLGDSVGPDLRSVVGRKAGALAGFKYSQAMLDTKIVWSKDVLRAFIRNPQQEVPGTTMSFPGYPNASDADAIVEYLKLFK